mmetsp:Transcript_30587/g.70004  ORF Transcript_30587/g.70004 Transcript_30587/m.70004 type:complete len:106 (+) Transcript_30587:603-920(+)
MMRKLEKKYADMPYLRSLLQKYLDNVRDRLGNLDNSTVLPSDFNNSTNSTDSTTAKNQIILEELKRSCTDDVPQATERGEANSQNHTPLNYVDDVFLSVVPNTEP